MNKFIRKRILQACYSFLLPVARFLLMSGISFREFAEVGRVAFVDVASRQYGLRGRPTNISRISAMTGIGRKDVSKLLRLIQEYADDLRVQLSPLSDVLHHWHTKPEFLHKGRPRRLPFGGMGDSFSELVKQCAGDVPAGAMKVELIRCGAVTVDENGLLQVIRREVVPESFDEKLITSLTFNLSGLASTIAFNTNPERQGPGRIERFVQSDNLDAHVKSELRLAVRRKVIRFTEELDDMFSEHETRDVIDKNRIGVGVYYYEDPN